MVVCNALATLAATRTAPVPRGDSYEWSQAVKLWTYDTPVASKLGAHHYIKFVLGQLYVMGKPLQYDFKNYLPRTRTILTQKMRVTIATFEIFFLRTGTTNVNRLWAKTPHYILKFWFRVENIHSIPAEKISRRHSTTFMRKVHPTPSSPKPTLLTMPTLDLFLSIASPHTLFLR